jgi:hypothetical protein
MTTCLRPGWLIDETPTGGRAPGRPRIPGYRLPACLATWSWWTVRSYDGAGRSSALFERCGLQDIRDKVATEVVRGGSPWARWWTPTLEVINELGGGGESERREVEVMATALADPSVWLQREVLHACWGRRVGDTVEPG